MHALDPFVLARYYMFSQIYFHDVGVPIPIVLNGWIADDVLKKLGGKYQVRTIEESLCDDSEFASKHVANHRMNSAMEPGDQPSAILEGVHVLKTRQTGVSQECRVGCCYQGQEFPVQFWLDRSIIPIGCG